MSKKVHGFAPPPADPTPLFEEKLRSSGLTLDDGKALGYTAMNEAETLKAGHWYWHPVPALKIPYYDPFSGQPMKFANNWPDFYRVRWLVEPPPNPNDPKKPKKAPKYHQKKDSGICAYFPTIGPFDWRKVLTDYEFPIIITEGELKAAAGCKAGFPTIGLGGVDNFVSPSNGFEIVPSLTNGITWARRVVTICYDSDIMTKPGVCRALNKLAEKLMDLGALPKVLILPHSGDAKVGLDDYLLEHTSEDLRNLLNEQGQFLTMVRELYRINDEWSYVKKFSCLVRHKDGDLVKATEFTSQFNDNVERRLIARNGAIESMMVNAGDAWLHWPGRAIIDGVTYDPSRPKLTVFEDEKTNDRLFNTWTGWGAHGRLEPKKGDVGPFLDLMKYLFTDASPAAMDWLIQWLGYPVCHPGTKLRTSAIVHGRGERIGKSSIGYTMKEIYGSNFQELRQHHLMGQFNAWQVRKQSIMCDDITGDNKYSTIDLIKTMISQQDVYVNEKNKPQYTIPDYANFLWTSNRPATFALSDNDSRFFVHKVEVVDPRPRAWWDAYWKWLREDGGAAALFHYFVHEVDYANFEPQGSALDTTAKEDMKEASQSGIGLYIRDLMAQGPEQIFKIEGGAINGRDMFTAEEIANFYNQTNDADKISARVVANVLIECGAVKSHPGIITTADGTRARYWTIRNIEKWQRASYEDKQDHLNRTFNLKARAPNVTPIKKTGKKF